MPPTPSPPPPPAPIPPAERLPLLDVLRGFALYGVLLANMVPWFSGRAFLPRQEALAATTRIDDVTLFLMGVLVNGKFQTLLSLLFGLGFSMQLARAEARGGSGVALYVRRLGAMFALGVCHVLALWWGDVLWGYAIAAIFLLFFRERSTRALLLWAAFFTFVLRLVTMLPAVAALIEAWRPHGHDYPAFRAQVLDAIRGHDHRLLVRMQAEHAIAFSAPILAWYLPWLLGRFLLGYAAGRSGRLVDVTAHLPFFRRLLAWSAGVGVVLSAATVGERLLQRRGMRVPLAAEMALTVPTEIGVLALVCAYTAAIVLLMQRPAWRRGLLLLVPVGRMPLTNYFSQSLICTFLFYGWGLGWLGRVSATLCVPLSMAIFAVQSLLSRQWLRYFCFGPVEWVWRSLSYGRAQPMRLDA